MTSYQVVKSLTRKGKIPNKVLGGRSIKSGVLCWYGNYGNLVTTNVIKTTKDDVLLICETAFIIWEHFSQQKLARRSVCSIGEPRGKRWISPPARYIVKTCSKSFILHVRGMGVWQDLEQVMVYSLCCVSDNIYVPNSYRLKSKKATSNYMTRVVMLVSLYLYYCK